VAWKQRFVVIFESFAPLHPTYPHISKGLK